MSDVDYTPIALRGDEESLHIEWNDGAVHELPWTYLRHNCPCASCRGHGGPPPEPVSEPTPEPGALPILSAAEAQPLRVSEMKAVGNYAYGIHFSDGHTTGIYTLEFLRDLGRAAEQARNP